MALVYRFPNDVLNNSGKILNSDDLLKKAILKAKCTPAHADEFLKQLKAKGSVIKAAVGDVGVAARDKIKGKTEFMKLAAKNPILGKVFAKTVLAPQFVFQAASFDLSVHLKGDNLQIWMTYKGGTTQTLLDVKKPK